MLSRSYRAKLESREIKRHRLIDIWPQALVLIVLMLFFAPATCNGAQPQASGEDDQFMSSAVESMTKETTRKRLVLTARKHIYPGDAFQVRVTHNGKPVWEPTLEEGLGETLGVIVNFSGVERVTNQEGIATFKVPETEHPANLTVMARKTGYWVYDTLTYRGVGYLYGAGLTATVYLTPGFYYSLSPDIEARLKRIKVVRTTNFSSVDLDHIKDKLKKTGVDTDQDSFDVSREEMEDSLTKHGNGDIWIFHGHTGDMDGDGKVDAIGDDDDKALTVKRICEAINKDGDPPSVIILSGCRSADIAAELCKCGARLVFGYTVKCNPWGGAKTIERLLEELIDGKTAEAAAIAASSTVTGTEGQGKVFVCEGSGEHDLETASLGDFLIRTPTTLDITSMIMQPTQNGREYELLFKAKLVDDKNNPVQGRIITFNYECHDRNNPSLVAFIDRFTAGRTEGDGVATSKLERIPRRSNRNYCKVTARFSGDAIYEGSEDTDYKDGQ